MRATVARTARSILIESLESRQLLSTYYVSASGRDSASGTSQSSAWRSITRANQQHLRSGDKVLFQGGKSFSGGIVVTSSEGGTTFGSYGSGRATINSGGKVGIDVANTAGLDIGNLNFFGSGTTVSHTSGIAVHIDATGKKLSGLHIHGVEVKNYGQLGIQVRVNGPGGSSLSNVKIEDAKLHDNLWGGLKATAMKHNVNKNWVVQRVKAYNNWGSRSKNDVTGSGIFIADVDGAIIQNCIAYNNGKDGKAPV